MACKVAIRFVERAPAVLRSASSNETVSPGSIALLAGAASLIKAEPAATIKLPET